MGIHKPPGYKVKRNGEWVWVFPPEQTYDTKDTFKPINTKNKFKPLNKKK